MFWGGSLRKRAMKYYRIYPFQWIGRERGKSRRGSPLPVLDKISNETVNTAPLCATLFALFCYIVRATSAPLCVLQCSIEIHPDFLGQERNNIQDFYPWSISGKKYIFDFDFDFNVLLDGHHRAKEKWPDSENLKLWSAFVWRYNLSSLTKWLIVLKPFLLSSFSIPEVFSLKFGF